MYRFRTLTSLWEVKEGRLVMLSDWPDEEPKPLGVPASVKWITYPTPGEVAECVHKASQQVFRLRVTEVIPCESAQ